SAARWSGKHSAAETVVPTRLKRPNDRSRRYQYMGERPKTVVKAQKGTANLRKKVALARPRCGRAYAPLFQGLRTTFSCVFQGFSRELSSHYIINTNCNALY